MLGLIIQAFGLALLGWLAVQGGGRLGPQRGRLSGEKTADSGTLWVAGSFLTPKQLSLAKHTKCKQKHLANIYKINKQPINLNDKIDGFRSADSWKPG